VSSGRRLPETRGVDNTREVVEANACQENPLSTRLLRTIASATSPAVAPPVGAVGLPVGPALTGVRLWPPLVCDGVSSSITPRPSVSVAPKQHFAPVVDYRPASGNQHGRRRNDDLVEGQIIDRAHARENRPGARD